MAGGQLGYSDAYHIWDAFDQCNGTRSATQAKKGGGFTWRAITATAFSHSERRISPRQIERGFPPVTRHASTRQ
ncbi:hypothetical protein HYPSUDRAFT_60478 [Hypholoma sublateritium FD-334 SS-4]|uniref:Uncharacterized protein n=1 Tax=Hypholoma sublateritium (strain FD-334 SS-4) TaxID=945553 RepID=A0A0D2QDE4_HYPSF|nr:hypothetical protein HYPSUDRAFT_60478 [Hypholoma sublateritium FD-334 SS-4]